MEIGLSNPESARLDHVSTETRAPSGKRLTRKGEQTRQRIVAAAAQLMYEQGVTEATLEEVRAATNRRCCSP
jgi:hypothetical protein